MTDVTDHYRNVVTFHDKAEQPVREVPTVPPAEERLLRAKLIMEECLETIHALGVAARVQVGGYVVTLCEQGIMFDDLGDDAPPNLVEIADGCADIAVVTTGTLIACGIADKKLQQIVDENNLAKFGEGGYRRDDGKWIKPPNHQPPDIEGLLREQGWEG